jgi:Protein of unknown function (DUF998)
MTIDLYEDHTSPLAHPRPVLGSNTPTGRPAMPLTGYGTAAGVVVFLAATIAVHLARTDLNLLSDPVSLYALGATGWLMTTAVVAAGLAGLLVVASAQKLSIAGSVFLTLWATGAFAGSAFPMDAPGEPATISGVIHTGAGFNFVFGIAAALLFGRSFKRAGRRTWARRARVSAWLLTASGASLVLFMGVLHSLQLGGLLQRGYWVAILAWLIAAQIAITSRPNTSASDQTATPDNPAT